MSFSIPMWADALTAALVVISALAALIGSFGLLRFRSFFQRIHAPTLGTTLGAWGLTIATVVQMSYAGGQLYVHALLVSIFIAATAPVSSLLLMRAAVFRARGRRDPNVPQITSDH